MQQHPPAAWLLPAAVGAVLSWNFHRDWSAMPIAPSAHELPSGCSCHFEFRQQLELRDQLDWFRLALAGVIALAALLAVLLCVATACACGFCAAAPRRRGETAAPRTATPTPRADPALLAVLAAQEVRRRDVFGHRRTSSADQLP